MTNADADALLVDTNVLVYAASPNAPLHSVALATLVRHRAAGRQLWISTQVIREFLVVMCNPNLTTPALHPEQAAVSVRYLLRRFFVAEDTADSMLQTRRLPNWYHSLRAQPKQPCSDFQIGLIRISQIRFQDRSRAIQ